MSRVVGPLVLGALVGAVAVYASHRLVRVGEPEQRVPSTTAAPFLGPAPPAALSDAGSATERSARSEPFAGSYDDPDLERLVQLAADDPEAAVAGLRALTPAVLQHRAALAVLEALGNDDTTMFRVASMLPESNRLGFEIDALTARAELDPASALRTALALDASAARHAAIPLVAQAAARLDPLQALRVASLIDNRELAALYLANVAQGWAERDAAAALEYLTNAIPGELPAQAAAHALTAIAARDHELMLENIDRLSPALQPAVRQAAILAIGAHDPEAAINHIAALPASQIRTDLEAAFAEQYAQEAPQAAVAWAKTLPSSQRALESALRGVAAVDYDLAVDLAMQVVETEAIWPAFALVESGAGDFSAFADRLLSSEVDDANVKMQQLMVRWPQVDAEAALEWARAHPSRLEQSWLRQLTLDGGRESPDLAMALLDEVPPTLRGEWLAGVAGGIGASNADRALAFLEQHRGEPGYEAGLANVAISITSTDPAAAARLIDRTGADAAGRVAFAWARTDPLAAAKWAASLEDPILRRDAVANLVSTWASADPDAAIDWLLELPPDSAREGGLQVALQPAAARTGSLDTRALDGIGDERRREQAALGAIVVLARSDPDEARRLVDVHLRDPMLRQQALQRIAQAGTSDISITTSMIDVPR